MKTQEGGTPPGLDAHEAANPKTQYDLKYKQRAHGVIDDLSSTQAVDTVDLTKQRLSLIHISEPTRPY